MEDELLQFKTPAASENELNEEGAKVSFMQRICVTVFLICYPGYQRFFSRAAGIYLTETGNRARKVSGTQGTDLLPLPPRLVVHLVTGVKALF